MLTANLKNEHFAKAMKLTVEEVNELAENPRKAYASPRMRPVGAKTRLITAPRRKWKMPLRWLSSFLRRKFGSHPAAHGSIEGRSPFTAAAQHLGPRNLVCRDVKDAFPSVKADRFYLELLALGFESEIARLMTKLLLPDGYIPQGGPTSNAALDLFFRRIDADICRELSVLHARYTRFTDGLDASLLSAARENAVALIIDRNLARLGLTVNARKLDRNGWQPIGTERVLCGVCVNSPRGTQLPRAVVRRLISECESLYRGARSVAPHTLVGLAKRRRSLQGWVNQASQADIAPIRDLQRRLHQVDVLVQTALRRGGLHLTCTWYIKSKAHDEAANIAEKWVRMRGRNMTARPPVGRVKISKAILCPMIPA